MGGYGYCGGLSDVDVWALVRISEVCREGGGQPAGEVFLKGIVEGLCEHCQALRLCLLHGECACHAAVVLAHLSELSGDLAWKFDAVLDGRIRFERLSLDLFEKIGSCSQELVV
jgi:hypothetical protein